MHWVLNEQVPPNSVQLHFTTTCLQARYGMLRGVYIPPPKSELFAECKWGEGKVGRKWLNTSQAHAAQTPFTLRHFSDAFKLKKAPENPMKIYFH